jgi:hypothetical protein
VFKVLSEFTSQIPTKGFELFDPSKILKDQGQQIDLKSSMNRYTPVCHIRLATATIDSSDFPKDPEIPKPAIGTVDPKYANKAMNRRILQ